MTTDLTDAEQRGLWQWYTDKLVLVRAAANRAENEGFRETWGKIAALLAEKREVYRVH